MAVTYITRIYVTIDKAINYIEKDKVVEIKKSALQVASDYLDNAIDYITNDKNLDNNEVKKTLTSVLNCSYDCAKNQFKVIREMYDNNTKQGVGKNQKEILGYHVWQSFEENIPPELSNEIGTKLAKELYGDFQCVVSTHSNTNHTHNHIVFNSVSFKDGRKYNINTANTRKLREVSDRLCQEYGLNVLENSRDMKLVKYKTKDGKIAYFEKSNASESKLEGKINKYGYRDYQDFKDVYKGNLSNREIIRKDIDKIILLSKDLEDFIIRLKSIGYEIKNKGSNEDDLKYISFKAPDQQKFTRGNAETLGKDYTRESIIKRISVINEKRTDKMISTYNYKDTNINEINIDFRPGNKRRSEVDRYVIADTRRLNNELESIYKKSNNVKLNNYSYNKSLNKKANYHISRINENLRTLSFLEQKKINSFEEINDKVTSLYEKKELINKEFIVIKDLLKKMNEDISLIKNYNKLKVEVLNTDNNYKMFELKGDSILLDNYKDLLKRKNLFSVNEQNIYIKKYDEFYTKFEELSVLNEELSYNIAEYDSTIKTINKIDEQYDNRYKNDIDKYYGIKSNYTR